MRIAVVGGTGRVGSRVVGRLREGGHRVAVASRRSGVDTITREGLQEAVNGAEVVVDLVDSNTVEEGPARWFFETSTQHLIAAERLAGVRHHVCLSIVGAQRVDGGYFRAKLAQEDRIRSSGVPFTILRSTQVFESLGVIADDATDGRLVRLAPLRVQPIALADLAAALADLAAGTPLNATVLIAGPEQLDLSEAAQSVLTASHDLRRVVPDGRYTYYLGSELESATPPCFHRFRSPSCTSETGC